MKCVFVGYCVENLPSSGAFFYSVRRFLPVQFHSGSLNELYSFSLDTFQSSGARFHKLLGKK